MREANLICFITNICVTFLIGALMAVTPYLNRKSLLFGVKIPLEEHNCPEAKAMKKRYAAVCLAGTVFIFALVILQFLALPDLTLVSVMYFPLIFVGIQMAAFIPNHKRAAALKEEHGWKITGSVFAETKSSHSRGNLSELPKIWYALSLMLAFAAIIATLVKYPGLPDIIPTHFGADMQPDAWAEKSLSAVLFMPLINLATALLMLPVGIMTVRAKLQIDPQTPALSFAQHHIYRRRMGHSLGFLTLGITIMMTLTCFMFLWPDFTLPFWLILALPLLACVPVMIIPVQSGQGGCKIKPKTIPETVPGEAYKDAGPGSCSRGDDKHWALGLFYHNPEDPAYIIEDRFGGNFGFNYSRLPVKIGVAAASLALIALYVWLTALMWPGTAAGIFQTEAIAFVRDMTVGL